MDEDNDNQLEERAQLLNRIRELEKLNLEKDKEIKELKNIIDDLQSKDKASAPQRPPTSLSPSTSQQEPATDSHEDYENEIIEVDLDNREQPVQISRFEQEDDVLCKTYLRIELSKCPNFDQGLLTVEDIVGKGSFGIVYKATYQEKLVVVKVLSLDVPLNEQCRELELATKLCHENVITAEFFYVTEIEVEVQNQLDNDDQKQCQVELKYYVNLVMPFMDKFDLRKVIEDRGRHITPEQCNKICFEVSKALVYLHSKNIVHRDLKPENIFISSQNEIKLGDYGLCAYCSEKIKTVRRCGTLPYMAPEVCNPGLHHTHNVDIWALGVTFCELLSKFDNAPYCFSDSLSNSEQRAKITKFRYPRYPLRIPDEKIPGGPDQYILSSEQDNIARGCLHQTITKRHKASALSELFKVLPHELLF